jgi:hypothetical protein
MAERAAAAQMADRRLGGRSFSSDIQDEEEPGFSP